MLATFSSLSVPLVGFLIFSIVNVGLAANFGDGAPTLTIMVEEGVGDDCTLNHETSPECNIASTTKTDNLDIQVKCEAAYPVTWSPSAVEQLGFVRASSRRDLNLDGVTSSVDLESAVTSYSMNLHLSYNHNKTVSLLDGSKGTTNFVFVCGAVGVGVRNGEFRSTTTATELTFKKDNLSTLVASFRLVDYTSGQLEQLQQQYNWSGLNRRRIDDPALELEFVPTQPRLDSDQDPDWANIKNCSVRCCVTPGALPESTAKSIRIWLGLCTHPLACVADYDRRPKTVPTAGELDEGLVESSRRRQRVQTCSAELCGALRSFAQHSSVYTYLYTIA